MTPSTTRLLMPDQRQFHQAISRGGNAWYGACLRITRDATLAQDAVQDALLSAWRKRRQFKGDSRLETWIHRIAVNAAIATVRRQRKYQSEPLEEVAGSGELTPDTLLAQSELSSDLSAALNILSELERVCFVLKHLEEWRLAEIADQLKVSTGSVKQALFRAVGKLRERMHSMRDVR